jgi:chemotaxis response regulator CheB
VVRVALFNEHTNEIPLVIDVEMPRMGGVEMVRELMKIKPSVKVIVASSITPPQNSCAEDEGRHFGNCPEGVNSVFRSVSSFR